MRGNNKPARGLFSGMKRTVVASATALSLAIGGMAVPAIPTPAGDSLLPAASAGPSGPWSDYDPNDPDKNHRGKKELGKDPEVTTDGNTYSLRQTFPLIKWKGDDLANAPTVLRELSQKAENGNYFSVVSSPTETREFNKITFNWPLKGGKPTNFDPSKEPPESAKVARTKENMFRAGKTYYVWVEQINAQGKRVLNDRVVEVVSETEGDALVLTLDDPMVLEKSANADTHLIAYGPGLNGPEVFGGNNHASVKLSEAAPQKGTIDGTVTDERANGAVVFVDGQKTDITVANGKFSIGDLAPGEYEVEIGETETTKASAAQTVTVKPGETAKPTFNVVAKVGNVTVTLDAPISFIHEARVDLLDADGNVDKTQGVRRGGSFTFKDVPVGDYRLEVSTSAFGYSGQTTDLFTLGTDQEQRHDLEVTARKATVKGRITDPKGNAVKDATVRIQGTDFTVTTEGDGSFEISGIPEGKYTIEISSTITTQGGTRDIELGPGEVLPIGDISVEYQKRDASGRVTNDAGKPIANAEVKLSGNGLKDLVTKTDGDGKYHFEDLEPGTYNVVIPASTAYEGIGGGKLVVEAHRDATQDFEVKRNKSVVYGKATIDGTNTPVPGMAVNLLQDGEVVERTTTNVDGSYQFGGVDAGTYTIKFVETDEVEGSEFNGNDGNGIVVQQGAPKKITAPLSYKKSNISGLVTLDTAPLRDVTVTVTNKSTGQIHRPKTDSRGYFELRQLDHGTYVASIAGKEGSYKETSSDEVEVRPGGTEALNISAVSEPGNIVGKVVDDAGNPVSDATVTAKDQKTTTGSDGTYRIDGLPKGEVTVTVANGKTYEGNTETVTVEPEEDVEANITVTRNPGSIAGEVTDTDGTIVPQGTVKVTDEDGNTQSVQIDNGQYSVDDLKPGKYEVKVVASAVTGEKTKNVEVSSNETADGDIEVPRIYGAYTLKVVDDLGKALADASVTVSGEGFNKTQKTGADGTVTFSNLTPDAQYTFSAVHDDYIEGGADFTATANGKSDSITLAPKKGSVKLKVSDDARNAIPFVDVQLKGNFRSGSKDELDRRVTTDKNGEFLFEEVPAGEYEVSVDSSTTHEEAAKPLTVRPNAETPIDLTVNRQNGHLKVSVIDANGGNVDDAKVVLKSADGKQTIPASKNNETGKYDFKDVRPGEYTVEVEGAQAYKGNSLDTVVEPGVEKSETLRVDPTDGSVRGTVVDEAGAKVANAAVTVTGNGVEEELPTDDNGEFSLSGLRPGNYKAVVTGTTEYNGDGAAFKIKPGEEANPTVTVRNKGTVAGSVVDDAYNVLSDVQVTIVDENGKNAVDVNGDPVSVDRTSPEGAFLVKDLAPGTYTASVEESDTHKEASTDFKVSTDGPTDAIEIIAQRLPGKLSGKVVDAETGEPVLNAKLSYVKEGEDSGHSLSLNPEGIFGEEIPAGEYTLRIESPDGYAPLAAVPFDMPAGGPRNLENIKLTSTVGSVEGEVKDAEGNGLQGVSVNLQNHNSGEIFPAETNEQGVFTKDLPVGKYTVSVEAPEGFDAPAAQAVEVNPSKTTPVTFELNRTPEKPKEGTVSGKVLGDDGNPIDAVTVTLKNLDTEDLYDATADQDGGFSVDAIPAGNYSVIATADGYSAPSNPHIKVEGGKNTDVGLIELTKDAAPSGDFRVLVTTGEGDSQKRVSDVSLIISNDEGFERGYFTKKDGEATGTLPVGEYSITTTPPSGSNFVTPSTSTKLVVEADGTNNVNIKLEPKEAPQDGATTGTVTGSIRDQNGDPVEGTTAELRGDDGKTIDLEVDENGDFSLPEVPEGEYTVVVTPGDGHRTPRYQEIEVTPGESTDVGRITTPTKKKQLDESDKGKPGTINGWLVDDMNEPIPGATVVITGKGTDTDADGNPIDTYPAVTVDPDGRFTTDELPEGEYEIDLELPEGWDKPEDWPKSVTVTKDEPQHQGVINVEAPRSEIKGAVVDGKGNPIDDVVVTVTDSHGDTKEVPVDENGEYTLDVVPGDAVVEVFTPEDVQDVDPMYIPVRPKVDVELPTVNLTEKTLKLQKRVLGWDADSPEDAPGLPKDEKLVYGFIVTNESDEKVTKVQIEDPFAGASIKAPEGFDGSIEPGDHVVFSAVMDAPYDSGAFANIAVARGLAQDGSMIASTPNEAYVTFMDMSLKKKVNAQFASNAKDPVRMAADRDLYFTYEVVNTGSVRMENVAVRDTIYEGDEKDFNPDNPGKGTPMEIIAPEGFTGTLMPGERAVFKGILPPLKPGTRHHNAAEAYGEAPEPPKRSKIFEDEPDYGDDPSGLLVVSPKENIDGNAHIVVEEGAPLPAITDINGSLYVDVNEDGKRDEGDKPYGGMEVTLHSSDGLPAVTETSDSNGEFVFKGVNAGNYTLQMRNPGGVILAEPLDEEKNDNGIGATLESKEFEVTGDEEALDKEILLLDRPIEIPEEPTPTPEPAPEGSSLGKCISETSSVSNPATWLIPIGILIAAMGGAAVLFEDQFNAAAAEFNKAMPSLNIQRPEWMNQISRQLAEIDPAVPAVALAVGIIAIGALVLGLTYASCESGKDFGSSNGEGSSSKDGGSSSKDEETTEPTEPAEESEESEDSEEKLTTAAVPAE